MKQFLLSHVKVHQDDQHWWANQERTLQLNCYCDVKAKKITQEVDMVEPPHQKRIPTGSHLHLCQKG